MEQTAKKSTSTLKESKSKKLLKSESEDNNFIGFDAGDDELNMFIEKKKKLIRETIADALKVSTDEPTVSPSNSNINRLEKKSQSKSRRSIPENNVKKFKKDNLQIEPVKCSETNIQNSLELTTPTFNLTSSTPKKNRKALPITDPIFKLPFDHGWKRELVYRTLGETTATSNKTSRNGDVYYYSPMNKKLRSLREIQEQLDLSKSSLSIESFNFVKQPIGMNDRSKELIREANSKSNNSKDNKTKHDSTVKSKKSKTPIHQPVNDFELSDNENTKMKICFKNIKKTKSTKENKNNVEPSTTISTPEYMAEERQESTVSPLKLDESTNVKQRLSTSDGEVIMQAPCGIRCPNSSEPATLMCAQCLVYYHPACVNLNANLKIVGYVCINCRSSVRQRNRRVQSSHTVVVGVSEPEQLRVEPIRIRQVHQTSDSSNFVIDKTSVSKSEEQYNDIDEHIDEDDSFINTVTCQGNVCKTVMSAGSFHEQYVYEMKQTRGPSLMTCVIQEPKHLDETSEMNGLSTITSSQVYSNMQSFSHMGSSIKHIFAYLKMKELLTVSRVCSTWRLIAKSSCLWQHVRLKNAMVSDWEKLINLMNMHGSISLDTRRMLMPSKVQDFDLFWSNFSKAIINATKLKAIELYRCPISVVHDVMCSLSQLEKLNAASIKNPNVTKDAKIVLNELMFFNIDCVSNMIHLTELRIKGLSGIKLLSTPKLTFSCLTKLKTLSLTSIKSFPKDICTGLGTISSDLEILEIGDCDCLPDDFAVFLKKLTNLRSLRLENCCGRWEKFAKENFDAIRSLKKLKKLELINIEFSDCVEQQLEKCDGITALLIIPAYVSQSATTNCHLLDCLEKLSKTLTHVVWGLTHELLRVTDLFITQYQQNQHNLGYSIDMSQTREPSNNIPILRSRKPKLQPVDLEITEIDTDKSDNVDILSVPSLQGWLNSMMVNAKTKVIKIPFSATTRAYLSEQFDDI